MTENVQIRRSKKYGTVDEWVRDSGMGRTSTYAALAAKRFRAIKSGKRTLIDYDSGFAYLDSLPDAEIRTLTARQYARRAAALDAADPPPSATAV
jgi:hypothetical protein